MTLVHRGGFTELELQTFPCSVFVMAWMRVVPIGSDLCLLSPQLMNWLEGSGGTALLAGEVCYWEWDWRVQKPMSTLAPSACLSE